MTTLNLRTVTFRESAVNQWEWERMQCHQFLYLKNPRNFLEIKRPHGTWWLIVLSELAIHHGNPTPPNAMPPHSPSTRNSRPY